MKKDECIYFNLSRDIDGLYINSFRISSAVYLKPYLLIVVNICHNVSARFSDCRLSNCKEQVCQDSNPKVGYAKVSAASTRVDGAS